MNCCDVIMEKERTSFEKDVIHGFFGVTILVLAFVGGFVIGTSGCPMSYKNSFCADNGQYIAGFVLLMLMVAIFIAWIIFYCVRKDLRCI